MQQFHSGRESYCMKCTPWHCGTAAERSSTSDGSNDGISDSGHEDQANYFRVIFQCRELQLESDGMAPDDVSLFEEDS